MIKKYSDFINESVYYDVNNNKINIGDFVEVKYTSGRYGQTKTVQGTITKIDQYNGITLDDELYLPGVFEYDYKALNHSHQGSLGNLCLDEIEYQFNKVRDKLLG